jgi:hypothetical protein
MKYLVLLFGMVCFCPSQAWTQINYAPNRVHIPNLERRFDGDAVFALGTGRSLSSIEFQVCFSPLKHWYVLGHTLNSGSPIQPDTYGAYYRFYEFGGGYYVPVRKGSFTVSGGWGSGKMDNGFGFSRYSKLSMERLFGQVGLYTRQGLWGLGAALRAVYLQYPSGSIDFSISNIRDLYSFATIDRTAPYFFPELGVQTGLHFSVFEVQANVCMVMADFSYLSFAHMNLGCSLEVDISDIITKKRKRKK